ncbi:MAG: DUF368 domain-containing protein [Enterocloster sp.]
MLLNAVRGFCMALADSVPGVSGGTIAFLLGFYDEFINSLNDIMGRDNEKRKKAVIFLIKLGIGWVIGFGMSVLILSSLFEAHIYQISSAFMGLTLFAIPMVIKEERQSMKGHMSCLVFTLFGMALVFAITCFNPSGGQGIDVSAGNLTPGIAAYVFAAAMIAITAMVLPGISGSTLLLIFGLYVPVIGAVKELIHLNFSYLPVVVIFGLGAAAGVVGIIKFIKMCLERYRPQTLYLIIGLMTGSLYAIAMGPTTLDTPQPPMSFHNFSIVFFLLGALILQLLEAMKRQMEKQ